MDKKTDRKGQSPLDNPDATDLFSQHVCRHVKKLRGDVGWTLDQLASISGVSRSMLSQIERGAANPTLAVAYRIARAFGITLGDLVDAPGMSPKIEVIRHDDTNNLFRDDDICSIRTLSPLHLEKDVEFYELRLKPGGSLNSSAHFEGTREFLTVEKGKIQLIAAGETTDLGEGDSAHYPADGPHSIENTNQGETVIFLVDIYGRSFRPSAPPEGI